MDYSEIEYENFYGFNVRISLQVSDGFVIICEKNNIKNEPGTFYFFIPQDNIPESIQKYFPNLETLFEFFKSKRNFYLVSENDEASVYLKPESIDEQIIIPLKKRKSLEKQLQYTFTKEFIIQVISKKTQFDFLKSLKTGGNRELSFHIDNEILVKEKVQKTGEKIRNTKDIPNFTLITNKDKREINIRRLGMAAILLPLNRKEAKEDFIELSKKASKQIEEEMKFKKKGIKILKTDPYYIKSLHYFIKNYKVVRNTKNCLKWYTKDSFFYKVLNKGLRILSSPTELCYLRLPFSDIFNSIKEIYRKTNYSYLFKKKNKFIGYRGGIMSEAEIKDLKNNVGGFIEMQGFISTSIKRNIALDFSTNVLTEILVKASNLGNQTDNGFADLSIISQYNSEKQIIFNALNIFKIISVEEETIQEPVTLNIHVIRLEYNPVKDIQMKKQKEQVLEKEQKEFLDHYEYQKSLIYRIKNQGDLLYRLFYWNEMLQYYKSFFERIKMNESFTLVKKEEIQKQKYYNNVKCGILCSLLYNNEKALEYYENCNKIIEKDSFQFCYVKILEGIVYEKLHKISLSLEKYKQAEKILKTLDNSSKFLRKLENFLSEKFSLEAINKEKNKVIQIISQKDGQVNIDVFREISLVSGKLIQQKQWQQAILKGEMARKIGQQAQLEKTYIYRRNLLFLLKSYSQINNKTKFIETMNQYKKYSFKSIESQKDLLQTLFLMEICHLSQSKFLIQILKKIQNSAPFKFQFSKEILKYLIKIGIKLKPQQLYLPQKYFIILQNLIKSLNGEQLEEYKTVKEILKGFISRQFQSILNVQYFHRSVDLQTNFRNVIIQNMSFHECLSLVQGKLQKGQIQIALQILMLMLRIFSIEKNLTQIRSYIEKWKNILTPVTGSEPICQLQEIFKETTIQIKNEKEKEFCQKILQQISSKILTQLQTIEEIVREKKRSEDLINI